MIKQVLSQLEVNDIEIIELSDGIELLNTVINDKSHRIKCIFTDENMEYMNGSEAVRIIRKLEQFRKIRSYEIVSITAFDDDETRKNILNSGVNSIITKPCSKSSITKIVSSLNNIKLIK